MKILIINSLYPPEIAGGAEISTEKLAIALTKTDNEVHVLCGSSKNSYKIENNVHIHRVLLKNTLPFNVLLKTSFKDPRKVIFKLLDCFNFFNYRFLKKIINGISPDIIHINNIYGFSPIIWTVTGKLKIPTLQTIRDYYLMCPKSSLMKKGGISCIHPTLFCSVFRAWHRSLSKKIKYVTAPSFYTLNKFIENGFFKKSFNSVIYNAIDYDIQNLYKIAEIKKQALCKKQINIIYVGTFSEAKGINVLLEAIKEAPKNIKFHFAGKGKLENEINNAAKENSNIVNHGFLNEDNLNDLLQHMDVLICPSIWGEPFGRVVIDAYKACLPVVVTNCGGLPELVDEGKTGLIIEPNSANAINKALLQIEGGSLFSSTIIDCICKKIEKFSIDAQVKSFHKLYVSMIEKEI